MVSDNATGTQVLRFSGIIEISVPIIRRHRRVRRQSNWVGMPIWAMEKFSANKKLRYLEVFPLAF